MHADTARVIERPTDVTASWLTAAIGAGVIADFDLERIGTGQMSECYRVQLRYEDAAGDPDRPQTVVLKVAAADPVSRQTGLALGLYEREVRFYGDVAPRLGGPIAPCYHAAIDAATGVFDLLLGDAGPAVVGDEIAGATIEQATRAVAELGRLHGPLLGDSSLAEASWLNRESPLSQAMITPLYAGFVDRYGDQIAAEHREVCERLVGSFDDYVAAEAQAARVQGLVHGDYRLDNMLFGTDGADRPLTVVDWQTVSWGPALTDLAYFVGCALPTQDRRAHYDALLRAYHEALGPAAPLTLADVAENTRRQSFFGVMMAIVSSMLVERTERGDRLFMTMLARNCDHALDTDALATLPAPATPEPRQPSEDDELAHSPTAEPLWSESWYADFADPAQGLGGWFRLGLIANEQTAWVQALLCGPDLPTVAVAVDVALPADPWVVHADGLELGHAAATPLQSYRVDLRGRGYSYSDPSALLRGEPGTPVELAMNLVWATDGTPYKYRITTRYEIPCTVSGTVAVDGKSYRVDAVAGQRDHSWGVRDWWGMDWMWSALHLDDGTHLHAINLRIPGVPGLSVGYAQDATGKIIELTTVNSRESFDVNGLPLDATLNLEPAELTASVEVQGNAPVRLTATDGRVSQFPRAWVSVETTDGRCGVGWVEWQPQPGSADIGAVAHRPPAPIVVMGVSGSGKSTVGCALAQRLRVPFVDGDTLHPSSNIAKMSAGEPLTDDDRYSWLEKVGDWLADHRHGGVASCSALKRIYRDQLRVHCPTTEFLYLSGTRELIASRIAARPGHFMPAALLRSQFDALQPLSPDEPGMAVDIGHDVDGILDIFLAGPARR